jgi:hypothetical protein
MIADLLDDFATRLETVALPVSVIAAEARQLAVIARDEYAQSHAQPETVTITDTRDVNKGPFGHGDLPESEDIDATDRKGKKR